MIRQGLLRAAWATVTLLITGCYRSGTPSLNHGVFINKPPEVKDLVQHTDCEIAEAMLLATGDNERYKLWKHLVRTTCRRVRRFHVDG